MVSAKLYGRLGNQMYQMAAVLAYSIKYNVPYCFPAKTINPEIWKRYFNWLFTCNGSAVTGVFWKEKTHAYKEIPKLPAQNVFLDGYFQSYKYFDFCIDKVRGMFNFKHEPKDDVCAIHVRRGDYLNHPTKHPTLGLEYYDTAIQKIINEVKAKRFIVFSDDISWCKLFFGTYFPDIDIKVSNELNEINAFEQIMNCQCIITANSSFSVMAATLNPNPDRFIICPHEDNYFGIENKHLDVSTLYPPDFHRIKF